MMLRANYYLIVKADAVIRRLMAQGALMTYREFAEAIGLLSPQQAWTPTIQRDVADILSIMAALERRFNTAGGLLDYKRIISPTQVRLMGGDSDSAA